MTLRFGEPAEDHSETLIELSTTMEVHSISKYLEQFLTHLTLSFALSLFRSRFLSFSFCFCLYLSLFLSFSVCDLWFTSFVSQYWMQSEYYIIS